jgi:hypothetical protein
MCLIPPASTRPRFLTRAESSQSRMTGRIADPTSSWNLAPIGQLSCFPGLLSTFLGSDIEGVGMPQALAALG